MHNSLSRLAASFKSFLQNLKYTIKSLSSFIRCFHSKKLFLSNAHLLICMCYSFGNDVPDFLFSHSTFMEGPITLVTVDTSSVLVFNTKFLFLLHYFVQNLLLIPQSLEIQKRIRKGNYMLPLKHSLYSIRHINIL